MLLQFFFRFFYYFILSPFISQLWIFVGCLLKVFTFFPSFWFIDSFEYKTGFLPLPVLTLLCIVALCLPLLNYWRPSVQCQIIY